MIATGKFLGVAGVAGVVHAAFVALDAIITAPVPPVHIDALFWNGEYVEFHRTVRGDDPIRASVQNEVVDVESEQTARDCLLVPARRADFTPDESEIKIFSMSQYLSPDCEAALVVGRKYAMITVIVPLDGGDPSVKRSEPFVWSGK